jgi:hypothetical protein
MTETVTVGGGQTTTGVPPTTPTTPTQPGGTAPGAPTVAAPSPSPSLAGAATLSVRRSQRGRTVRGSLQVPGGSAGGRLQVDLLASRAALARSGGAPVRVGRLVRSSLKAGRLSFAVSLDARGRRALARRHRLPVLVRIALTPPQGSPALARRSVLLHS